ncbi:unnamed protein product, partial [Darwinula stevensoni]
ILPILHRSHTEGYAGLRYTSLCGGSGSCDPNWDDALKAWQDEIKQLSLGHVELFPIGETTPLELTMMIWAKSDKAGCHAAACDGNISYLCILSPQYGRIQVV